VTFATDFATDPLVDLGRIHLIGVGGAGMSALTRMLCARGAPVTGSELRESRMVEALRALGATVHLGQDDQSLPSVDTVVVSTAIRETNPELVEAKARGLRIMHRADRLLHACEEVRGGGGNSWEDYDHLDARRGPTALRRRPLLLHRCAIGLGAPRDADGHEW
jgi:hypothetical protein